MKGNTARSVFADVEMCDRDRPCSEQHPCADHKLEELERKWLEAERECARLRAALALAQKERA